jgi:hypothetical protein
MLDNAFPHTEREIQSAMGLVAFLEPRHNPQSVKVVIEAPAVFPECQIQRPFSRVAKGRVADVVSQGERLGQLAVEAQSEGNRPGYLNYLQRVRQPAAKVVSEPFTGHTGENLGLAGKPAKRTRMEDSGGIARKRGSVWVTGFRMLTASQIAAPIDGNPRGQQCC